MYHSDVEHSILPMKAFLLCICLVFMAFLQSCNNHSCTSLNPVLSAYPPESEQYKKELARLIAEVDPHQLTFWIEGYQRRGEAEYLQVHIQGDDLCAHSELRIEHWQKLEGIRRSAGRGYKGAELVGLLFDTRTDSTGTTFVYKDVERISD
jgi:hypothetical protein